MQQPSLLDILTHTPSWVWAVLVLVIWIGLRRTRDRDVSPSRLVLFPLIIAALAVSNMAGSGFGAATLEGLLLGALTGVYAAFVLEKRNGAIKLPDGRVRLAGEWTSLAVIVAIFLSRYVTTVIGTVYPATAAGDGFHFVTALLSGFFSVMMLVRTGLRLRVALA